MEQQIKNELVPYKTGKKMMSFTMKLLPSKDRPLGRCDGKIGIMINDYSAGTGDKAVIVSCNIDPKDVELVDRKICAIEVCKRFQYKNSDTLLEQTKIFGNPDEKGLSRVTKLKIYRSPVSKSGEAYRLPIFVSIENGRAKKIVRQNGATQADSNSYVKEKMAMIQLSDDDFASMIIDVLCSIRRFETVYCTQAIKPVYEALWSKPEAQKTERKEAENHAETAKAKNPAQSPAKDDQSSGQQKVVINLIPVSNVLEENGEFVFRGKTQGNKYYTAVFSKELTELSSFGKVCDGIKKIIDTKSEGSLGLLVVPRFDQNKKMQYLITGYNRAS